MSDNTLDNTVNNTCSAWAKERFLEVFDQSMLNTAIEELTKDIQSKLKHDTNGIELQELMLDLRSVNNIKKYLQKVINSSVNK